MCCKPQESYHVLPHICTLPSEFWNRAFYAVFTVFNEIRDEWATGRQTSPSPGLKCADGVWSWSFFKWCLLRVFLWHQQKGRISQSCFLSTSVGFSQALNINMGLTVNQGLILWQTAGWENDGVVKGYIYLCVGCLWFFLQILGQLYGEKCIGEDLVLIIRF